eukprot:m.19211 g.19211  ORF g.19211 m.19211 type:complete len:630 (+) comp27810_c0_seq8:14-1903(+)
MEDDDEDVIFENSPLYRHLKENSDLLDQFELHPVLPENKTDKEEDLQLTDESKESFLKYLQLKDKFLPQFPTDKSISQLQKVVISSSVLEKDDIAFIQSIDPALIDSAVSNFSTFPSCDVPIWEKFSSCYFTVTLFGFLLATFAYFEVLFYTGILLATLTVLIYFLRQTIQKAWLKEFKEELSSINHLLDLLESYVKSYSKCLQLLRDLEIIARGYRGSMHWLQPYLGSAPCEHCPALRQLMHDSGLHVLHALRKATIHLINNRPLGTFIDHSSHYLACASFIEIGLKVNSTEWAVSELRDILSVIKRHISELFCRVGLAFSPVCLNFDQLGETEKRLKFQTAVRCVGRAVRDLTQCIRKQNRDLIVAFQGQRSYLQEKETTSQIKLTKGYEEVKVKACQALELRLQSSLLRVRQLADEIAGREEDQSRVEVLAKWIEADVALCASSCADLQTALQPAPSQQASETTNGDIKEEIPNPLNDDKYQSNDTSPESTDTEDEKVYEAYADASEDVTMGRRARVTPTEMEERQKRAEESVRMIKELKSVLAAKAVEKAKTKNIVPAATAEDLEREQKQVREVGKTEEIENTGPRMKESQWMNQAAFAAAAMAGMRRRAVKVSELEAEGEFDVE